MMVLFRNKVVLLSLTILSIAHIDEIYRLILKPRKTGENWAIKWY